MVFTEARYRGRWFQTALIKRDFAVGKVPAGTTAVPSDVIFAYPVIGTEGRPLGVVFAELDIRRIYRFQSGIEKQLPEGSTITQVNDPGVVLTRYPETDNWLRRSMVENLLSTSCVSQKRTL